MNIKLTSLKKIIVLTILITGLSNTLHAQYFGQNIVRYKNEKFKVLQTPHFELYYYLNNDKLIQKFAKDAEIWYKIHQEIFRDTFFKKNPIILYNNQPDFQQTTALQGEIGLGTSGVTESLKNRIIMPVMELESQTRHVLGHELVHAFQYNLILKKDSVNQENIGDIPLWMVEGMAEYLSLGKKDAFTSMWMRDAFLNRDIPSLKDLTNSNKYFPYRYGQAFWAFIGSAYGDTTIVPLFKATAKFGYEKALKHTLGQDDKAISGLWKNTIESHYRPLLKADSSQVKVIGTKITNHKNAGNMNVAPCISPDGQYVAFLSEKDLLGIDLFLADAKSGRIIRKLSSQISNSHIDDFNFLESAGAWSPDSKQFAFSIYSKGRNQMMILDVASGKIMLRTKMENIPQFGNLSWAPNGKEIAFSGMIEGQSDIFSYNLQTTQITQITNDVYSDYAPSYSPDGSKLIFSSDRGILETKNQEELNPINLTLYELDTKTFKNLPVFQGSKNLNPQFSADGKSIVFLSNRDGFRNLYKYNLNDKTTDQLTDYFTGISGITEFSPAISISRDDDIIYSYYRHQGYTLYHARLSDFKSKKADSLLMTFESAILTPKKHSGLDIVNHNLANFKQFESITTDSMKLVSYRPKFKLDYLANSGIGVSTGRFNTGIQGGIAGMFSDILGKNQIIANLSINGQISDIGAMIGYINQENRINWGAAISHTPYISGFRQITKSNLAPAQEKKDSIKAYNDHTDIIRTFEEQLQIFAAYPFNKIHRFEAGAAFLKYSYRVDRYNNYYENRNDTIGAYLGSDKYRISNQQASRELNISLNSFSIFKLNASFVGDHSNFGLTSPLEGFRYRIGAEQYFGDYKFYALNIDLRKYFRLKPITAAFRGYSYLRIGKDGENLYPLYLGYPYLIRGYESASLYNSKDPNSGTFDINQLSGSKIAVFNFEIRLPFTGPKKLTQIPSKFLFTDLNLFFDAGLAWNEDSKVAFKSQPNAPLLSNGKPSERVPALSAGISIRINIFGAFVLEPYYALPFQRKDIKAGVFGVTFAPGW